MEIYSTFLALVSLQDFLVVKFTGRIGTKDAINTKDWHDEVNGGRGLTFLFLFFFCSICGTFFLVLPPSRCHGLFVLRPEICGHENCVLS